MIGNGHDCALTVCAFAVSRRLRVIRCRVARRASWAASGAGRRARAASSCAWSMTLGSGAVTGTGWLGSVAGFGAGIGIVGVSLPWWLRVLRSSSRRRPRCWLRGCRRRRLGAGGGIVGVGRSSGRNGWRGSGGSVLAVLVVPPGRPRGRPAPRCANPTVGPDLIPPNRRRVPPRPPK